jgi:hypothetical protein
MDDGAFDRLTRRVGGAFSRRTTLAAAVGAGLTAVLGPTQPPTAAKRKPKCKKGERRCGKICCNRKHCNCEPDRDGKAGCFEETSGGNCCESNAECPSTQRCIGVCMAGSEPGRCFDFCSKA